MHGYSINVNERKLVPFLIAAASIGLVFLIKHNFRLPDWIPVPSVLAVYGVLFALFDKIIWRIGFLHSWGLIATPDLNGEWIMTSNSSKTEQKVQYSGKLYIDQTWNEINIFFDGNIATSNSLMASINFLNKKKFSIEWEYLSKKKPDHSEDEYMHYGMTRLELDLSQSEIVLRGDYFTDRSRHNYGNVQIKKA